MKRNYFRYMPTIFIGIFTLMGVVFCYEYFFVEKSLTLLLATKLFWILGTAINISITLLICRLLDR